MRSKQWRDRISKAVKEYWKDKTRTFPEHCKELARIRMTGNTYRKGKKMPKEYVDNLSKRMTGKGNCRWNGGKSIDKGGYITIWTNIHPNRAQNNRVREHRLVVEKRIGRLLEKTEFVHHIDKNKQNNRITNLMVFASHSAHTRYESGGHVEPHEIIFNGKTRRKK
jgi:hypothetical protein